MADYTLEMAEIADWNPLEFNQLIELTWRTKEGKDIPVRLMTPSHLDNCINLLKRRVKDSNFWITAFEEELQIRNAEAKAKNERKSRS